MRLFDLDSAFTFCTQTIELAKEMKSDSFHVEGLVDLAIVLKRSNRYEELLDASKEGIQLAKKMNLPAREASFLMDKGNYYERSGDADMAASVWLEALKIAKTHKENTLIGIALINLGNGYYYQSAFEKALDYYRQSYEHYKALKEGFWMHTAASNIAECYRMLGRAEEGINLANEAIHYFDSVGNDQMLYYPLNTLSEILLEKEDRISLKPIFAKLEKLVNNPPNLEKQTRLLHQFARNEIAQKNWAKASDYATKALAYSRELGDQNLLTDAIKTRVLTLENLQEYKAAFSLMKELQTLSDSISSAEAKVAYDELNLKYQSEQKDLLLAEKTLDLQKQLSNQKLLLMLLIILIAISGSIYLLYRQRKIVHKKEIEKAEQNLIIQNMRAMIQGEERERARLARELHDGVGGMISAIKMKASTLLQNGSDTETEIIPLLDKTSAEIRRTAHNLMPEILTRFGLVEAIKDYIQQIRNDGSTLIEFQSYEVPADLVKEVQLNIYRITQELINNALKHSEATEILVQLSGTNDRLMLSVDDNGNGELNKTGKTKGMGLKTVEYRVQWMGGKWDMQFQPGQGVSHQIDIPLKTEKI